MCLAPEPTRSLPAGRNGRSSTDHGEIRSVGITILQPILLVKQIPKAENKRQTARL